MMRISALTAGLLTLVLAACTVGGSPAPSSVPTEVPGEPAAAVTTPTPTTAPTPTPARTPTAVLEVRVTFDGETCTYLGPAVVPHGTMLRFEFAPDEAVSDADVLVYAVEPGTTYQDLLDWLEVYGGDNVAANVPPWVRQETVGYTNGAGTMLYMVEAMKPNADGESVAVGGYQILCATPAVFPAAQLSLAGS
jgi:hypothetical protein